MSSLNQNLHNDVQSIIANMININISSTDYSDFLYNTVVETSTNKKKELSNNEKTKVSKMFYSMLNEEPEVEYDDTGKCLITHEPLDSNHIKLNCNHEFNYIPIFKYLVNFKKNFNRYETKRLRANEIICPYCRSIEDKLLPYIPLPGVTEVHGVNAELYSRRIKGACEYNGCNSTTVYTYYSDNKHYCYYHCNMMIQNDEKRKKNENKINNRCTYIYLRGKNSGNRCTTIAKTNCLCSKHTPKIKKIKNANNESSIPTELIDEIPEPDIPVDDCVVIST
jgi:hypothetical protein